MCGSSRLEIGGLLLLPSASGVGLRGTSVGADDREELDVELERGFRRDLVAAAGLAVGELPRDRELSLSADLHARNAFVPALDHPALAKLELERVLAYRAVELLPVHQR